MQKTLRKQSIAIYILSFAVPSLCLMSAFAVMGVYPFGKNMAVTGDALYQFIDFISYLKTVFFGNNDFTYSLSKNLGGEMAGLAAYYYFSPLNLITLLFSEETLPTALFVIFCLGPGLCSLCMCICLNSLKGTSWKNLIFSFAYGLSGFMIVYVELFHYYTDIILLPLVYLGLKRLLEKRKPDLCYILSLAISIISNYYFGYMICIFCALIYVYEFLLDKEKIKGFAAFAISSVTAGALSAFTLLPAVLSLRGEKSNLSIGFFLLFNPFDLFSKFYTGSFKGDFGTGLPNIYCGILTLIFLLLYFFNRGIKLKEKIITGIFLMFFWMNFCINTLNVVWHGFNQPIGYPQRFAYIVVFFIIIKAREAFEDEEAENKKTLMVLSALFICYSVYLLLSHNKNTGVFEIVISAAFFAAFLLLLQRKPKGQVIFLVLLTVADLFANAVISFDHFGLQKYEDYSIPVVRTKAMTDFVKEKDPGLYRMEKYFRRSNNDAFMHGYAGLSHYSSSEKMSTIRFMGRLGFRDNGNWAFYGEGNSALADSLLGVKYVMSQFDSTGKPYEKIHETEEGYTVFENPYALPILFASDFADDIEDYESIRDPFLLQERMADGINGRNNGIFSAIPAVKTYEDDKRAVYEITVERDGMTEAYFDAPSEQKVRIYYNGEDFGEYFSSFRWNVLDLGRQKKGTKIEVALESETDDDLELSGAYFYTEDYEALKGFYEDAVSEKCEIKKISSSHYTGIVDIAESRGAVFCVPYDENWRVSVDGGEAQITRTAGNLLGVRLPEGEHTIEFKFISPGQKAGNMISGMAVLLLGIYAVISRKKKT